MSFSVGAEQYDLARRLGADAVCAVDPSESFVAAIADRYPECGSSAGGQGPLGVFGDAARGLDAHVEDESELAGAREGHLGALLRTAGASDVRETALSVDVMHASFEEWRDAFLLGVGPAGKYVSRLDATRQARLRDVCRDRLPRAPFVASARAWGARGVARGVARGDSDLGSVATR